MKFYIYQIWFPTSKKSYIGQTFNLKRRMKEHFHSGCLVCKALWKYDDWQISILHACKTRDAANLLEIEEIRNFSSIAPNGYNLTAGGEGLNNYQPSKETRKKLSEAAKGNKSAKGTKHSEEFRSSLLGNKRASVKRSEEFKENMKGNKRGKGYKNTKEQTTKWHISRLKNKLRKLENGKDT